MTRFMKTSILSTNCVHRSLKSFLAALLMAFFALLAKAQAVSPSPDGGYPGNNTAEGDSALLSLTVGQDNTATGFHALSFNTFGSANTAIGSDALIDNTTGNSDTATGFHALAFNTTGNNNTATGVNALERNTTGGNNTAAGLNALEGNTTGSTNTANGWEALFNNTTGSQNTAAGFGALFENTTGRNNTADGFRALYDNTTGIHNVALGYGAGLGLTTGSGNVYIGAGVLGVAGESNTSRIRNVYSSPASGRAVYVNSDNKIGTLSSSRRYKEQIKPMDKASEAILEVRPVSFRYKREVDPPRVPMFGLIAEEVEKVDPDLVTRNEKGEAETVRYDAVNAMLLNEFLKEHRRIEEQDYKMQTQEATIVELKSAVAQQQKQIEGLTAGLQKVSAQLETTERTPQTVSSNQ
jgi:uncharacterized coiled-coil protein SlyX